MTSVHTKDIKRFLKLRQKAQEQNNGKEEAELCNVLGDLYLKNGDTSESLLMHQQEFSLCEALGDVSGQAIAQRKIGDVYLSMNNYKRAIKHHTNHLELANVAADKVEMQRANTSLGRTLLDKATYQEDDSIQISSLLSKSISLFDESLKLVRELKLGKKQIVEMQIRSLINLGLAYDQLSNTTGSSATLKSQEYFQKALCLARKHDYKEDLCLAHRVLTGVNMDLNKYSNALRHAEALLRTAKQLKDNETILKSYELCSEVHLIMENIDAAKDCLKRIYIKAKNGLLRDEAEAKLRPVIKMCHINRELSMEDTEINRKYSLHEALADLYCKVGCFAPALKHYKCQEVLLDLIEGITKHQRKAVYFSIASTLVDLNKFQEALTYYNKELDVSTDNMELADIHMNIAKCLESNSSSVDEVMSSCQKAIQCAENSGIDRTKLKALICRKDLEIKYKEFEAADRSKEEISLLELQVGILEDDSEKMEDCYNSCTLDDSSDLIKQELEIPFDDEIGIGESRRTKRNSLFSKQNCVGESGLHQACIAGDLKRVQFLINQGHPMNPRDFSGWTPLHEACNHGHLEIVRCLLENGAHINDMGGQHCGNLTPINDAAYNGHFDIVNLLLTHKANPFFPNDEGLNVLDTLNKYYATYGEFLEEDQRSLYKELKTKLEGMKQQQPSINQSIQCDDEIAATTSSLLVHDSQSDVVCQSTMRKSDPVAETDNCATRSVEYSVLLPTISASTQKQSRTKRSIPALIPSDEESSDWLVEDLEITQPKKKRRFHGVPDIVSQKKKKTTKITDFCQPSDEVETVEIDADDDHIIVENTLHKETGHVLSEPRSNNLRLKVEIEQITFYVAVPKDKTVAWLKTCVSSRYEQHYHLLPNVNLSSCGVLLNDDDLVSVLLQNNDTVTALVASWHVLPLCERYSKHCKTSKISIIKSSIPKSISPPPLTVKLPRIMSACRDYESTKLLKVSNLHFPQHLKPLFVNLRKQEIHKLNLAGCRLGEEGVKCLCENVEPPNESHLAQLNLSSTAMNDQALMCLAKHKHFHNLTHLNMSYNPLCTDNGLSSLLSVCTSLRYLNLQRCYLQNCTLKSIDDVSKGLEKLEVLNISQNNLGGSAIAKWLSAINRNQIKSLNLSRVSKNDKNLRLIRIIHDFLIKSSKKLEFLDISHNELDLEECIQELMSCTSIVDEINVGSNMNIVNLPSLQYHCVKCIC